YVLRSFTAIRDASEKVIGVQMITSDITAQKNAELRFHLAATVASDLVYEWVLESDTVTWFGDIDQALGYAQGTIAHTFAGWEMLVHPEDRARIKDAPLSHRTATVPIHQEYRVKTADGRWQTWVDRATPVLNDRGAPVRWIGVCEDVTAERGTAHELEVEQQQLLSLMQFMPAFLYLQAQDHSIPFANARFREYFGDPEGRKCHEIFRSAAAPCSPCTTLNVLSTRQEMIREWTDDQGRVFELREHPYKTADGQEYVLVIGVEITDLIQATHALRSSEQRFRELAEMLPEAVFECDLEGRLSFANQAAFRSFGYTQAQFSSGLNAFDMLADEDVDRIRASVGRLLAGGEERSTRYTARRNNGSTFPVIIHSCLIRQGGQPIGLRGIVVDITDQLLSQVALSESESKLRAILDAVPDLLFQLDKNDQIISYHAPPEQLYAPSSTFLGKRFEQVLPPEPGGKLHAALAALKQTGIMQQIEYSLPIQGQLKDFEARILRGDAGSTLVIIRDISERKQALNAMEMAASIIRSTPVGMFIYRYEDPDRFILVDANPEAEKLTGIRLSEWRHREFSEIWPDALASGLRDAYLMAFRTNAIFSTDDLAIEDRQIAGDYRIRAFRVPGDRLVVSFEDMSQQIEAQLKLGESERRYRSMVETSPVGILTVTPVGRIASVNGAFLSMTGYQSEDLVGKHFTKIPAVHTKDLPQYVRTFRAIVTGKIPEPFESSWTTRDGQIRHGVIQVALLKGADRAWSAQVVVQDVTDRHEAAEALKRSEAEYRSLFENAALGIYRTTPDGRILAANDSLVRMLGYDSFDQLEQRNLEQEGHEPMSPRSEFKRLMEMTGRVEGLESSWRCRDGAAIVVREHAYAVRDAAGKIAYYEGTLEDITERVIAERQLRESEATQRSILHASPIGIGLIRDGKFQWVSDRISEMCGYSVDELIEQSPLLTAPGASEFERIQRDMEQEMARCGVAETETQWKRKDGSLFHVNLRFASLDPADPSKGGIFTLLDITDRKQMEESLRLTQYSIDSTNVIILWLRATGEVVFANDAACRQLGYTRAELLKKHAWNITLDYPRDRRAALWNELEAAGSEKSETIILRKDGTQFPAEMTAQFLNFQGTEYEFVLAIDISERKAAEAALLQSEENYRTIFNLAGDVIMLHDAQTGRLLDVNERIQDMFGYSVNEFLLLQVCDFSSREPKYSQEEALTRIHAAAAGSPQVFEWHARKQNGALFWVEVSLRCVTLLGNSVVLAVVRDISERKALEAQLRQGQKLESIGTLASGVAHEINNPLMGMINYAELISSRIGSSPLKEYAEGIKLEGDRVAKIVRNLLSFSRQDQEQHSPARMIDVIEASLSLIGSLLRKDYIQLAIDVPEDLPIVRCRSQQMQQVFINLVTNARDSLNSRYPGPHLDKRICIASSVLREDEQSWLRSTVEDFGKGMAKDLVTRIFDPFFTTKARNEGTGLGLSISYGIVRDHGGRLEVESEEGQFTRFHVDLPLAEADLD
ncbi:PAS domain S-box protein, partial [Candidatus Bipolaricaulota bacterium]|nr:PAS domain S-box protein [Candidatus Bipolaricaulota bacterium]